MALMDVVLAILKFLKVRLLVDKARIDNVVFKLHYMLTSGIFFLFSTFVTATHLWGSPISCVYDAPTIPQYVINTYCWVSSTYTFPGKNPGDTLPGIVNDGIGGDKVFHSYYQWVGFILFFQAICFRVPHMIWKNREEGKIQKLSEGIRGTLLQDEERKEKQTRLVQYLVDTQHMHNMYAFAYYFCEALNFIFVVGNIFFLDRFLGGAFLKYGIKVLQFVVLDQEQRTDPMIEIFPRLTKCVFHKVGSSGSIELHDALCVLSSNIFNEKIFVFIWFWLIILSLLSGLALIHSAIIIMSPSIRSGYLKKFFIVNPPAGIDVVIQKAQIGDFLILHLLGKNLEPNVFGEIIEELAIQLKR